MREAEGMCPNCKGHWSIRNLERSAFACIHCGHQMKLESIVPVRSANGKVLTPCTTDRANKEVSAGRARWEADGTLWLYDAPEQNAFYRNTVLERDHHTCLWCGEWGNTVDHIVPYSEGGLFHPINLFCACEKCNQKRKNQDAFLFLELLAGEGAPSPFAGYVVERYDLATSCVQQMKENQAGDLEGF